MHVDRHLCNTRTYPPRGRHSAADGSGGVRRLPCCNARVLSGDGRWPGSRSEHPASTRAAPTSWVAAGGLKLFGKSTESVARKIPTHQSLTSSASGALHESSWVAYSSLSVDSQAELCKNPTLLPMLRDVERVLTARGWISLYPTAAEQ